MDVERLIELYEKVLYQETLDLDGDEARYILQDLLDEAIARQTVKSEDVAISKTATTSCKWCDNADKMGVNVKTVSDSGKWVGMKRFSSSKSTFCPNCGRKLVK